MHEKTTLDDALELMRDLRKRCDWDAAQTHDSLRPYLIEEAHELDDAIHSGNAHAMREELGDLLLQVLFHSVIADETGEFDANDVAHSLVTKMKARHPHLYGDGDREPWERMKSSQRESISSGLPTGLPPLHRAHRLQDRAAGVGFDWPDVTGPASKVEEELAEVREQLAHRPQLTSGAAPTLDPDHALLEAELGDLLFACVNLCRKAGVHASLALDRANLKFESRFKRIEELCRARGIVLSEAGLEKLDALWDEAKREE